MAQNDGGLTRSVHVELGATRVSQVSRISTNFHFHFFYFSRAAKKFPLRSIYIYKFPYTQAVIFFLRLRFRAFASLWVQFVRIYRLYLRTPRRTKCVAAWFFPRRVWFCVWRPLKIVGIVGNASIRMVGASVQRYSFKCGRKTHECTHAERGRRKDGRIRRGFAFYYPRLPSSSCM